MPSTLEGSKNFTGKSYSTIPTLNYLGKTAHTDTFKANRNFNHSVPLLDLSEDSQLTLDENDCPTDLLCTEDEILQHLQNLDVSKSNGPDGISAKMLKIHHAASPPHLQTIQYLNSVRLCPLWMEIVYEKSVPTNYRPISLLPIFSKILTKAFDTVPHTALLEKLTSIGLNKYFIKWVARYFNGRKQQVVVNRSCSNFLPIITGVPRGFVLGPLLFIIYINEVAQLPLTVDLKLAMYADDILLYRPVRSTADLICLQEDATSLGLWDNSVNLRFNP